MKEIELHEQAAKARSGLAVRLGRSSAFACGIAAFGCAAASAAADEPAPTQVLQDQTTGTQPSPSQTPADQGAVQSLQQVTVTGTSIRGVTPTGSNLISVSRSAIDATSAQTTDQLLATVPSLGSFNTLPTATTFIPGGSSPAIHGIPAGATLTLIDGSRFGASGIVIDPSIVPLPAIERVEIIPDGASSIYGSDAVAGVVNIITRQNFSGVQATARGGLGDSYDTYDFGLLAGTKWSGGGIYAAYDHSHHGDIQARDRNYTSLNQTSRGGKDYRYPFCSPANISVNGVNYALPALAPNTTNLCDNGGAQDLLPAQTRDSLFIKAHDELSDRINTFGSITLSDDRQTDKIAPTNVSLTVPSSNPYFIAPPGTNASSETVTFNIGKDFGSYVPFDYEARSAHINGGVDFDLGHEWALSAVGNYNWERDTIVGGGVDTAQLQNAANGTTTADAYNPYGVGAATDPAVIEALSGSGESYNKGQAIGEEGLLKADGPLFALPAGDIKAALGIDVRHESHSAVQLGSAAETGSGPEGPVLSASGGRTIQSGFLEFLVPVFGKTNALPGVRSLDISASGRYDHYSDFGVTRNPKLGLNWSPAQGLVLHTSWGKSFNAPSLSDTHAVDTRVQPEPAIFGPALGNLLVLAGGSPDLKPQTATTKSAGFEFQPDFVPKLRFSATYFKLTYKDLIEIPSLADLLSGNPAFAQYVIFNPTQAQIAQTLAIAPVNGTVFTPVGTILDLRRTNLGIQKTSGVDFDINYGFSTPVGGFILDAGGTYLTGYRTAADPSSALSGSLNQQVRLHARGGISWSYDIYGASLFANYTGRYDNTTLMPFQRVDPFTTVDLHLTYDLKGGGWMQNTQLICDVQNLFDDQPPFYNSPDFVGNTAGYDLTNASPLGRVVSLGVRKKF